MASLISGAPPALSTTTATAPKRCFDAVVDAGTRLLILGSLPGERSLALQQYYGNRHNRFWQLLSAVLGVDLVARAYPDRLATLLAHGVGLWDVVAQAQRQGSLDSQIRQREDNDLTALLARFPAIGALAFNGGTAARVGVKGLGAQAAQYRVLVLPSSSPAYTLAYDAKLAQWMQLGAVLADADHEWPKRRAGRDHPSRVSTRTVDST